MYFQQDENKTDLKMVPTTTSRTEISSASQAVFSLMTEKQPDTKHMAAAKMRPIKHGYPDMISVDVLNNELTGHLNRWHRAAC